MILEEFNTELQQWEYTVHLCSINRIPLEHVVEAVQKSLGSESYPSTQ